MLNPHHRSLRRIIAVAVSVCGTLALEGAEKPVIIAHRGASGYVPEHTLAAKAMAYAMGADFIEQDVVLTKDDHPVVLHDIHLDTVTNVAERFPDRKRADGRYYAIDFTISEIRTLTVSERIDLDTGQAVYAKRFPAGKSAFRLPTLAEEIELIQGLNQSTGRNVGIYPEIKSPAWHQKQGKDISRIVLSVLAEYGYRTKSDHVWLQCFDAAELKRIRRQLGCRLKLTQLIGENDWNDAVSDHDTLRTPDGLASIAQYADGIGPRLEHIVVGRNNQGKLILSPLVRQAHTFDLQVHPYTVRSDSLPEHVETLEQLLRVCLVDVGVDGLFADFPDQVIRLREQLLEVPTR